MSQFGENHFRQAIKREIKFQPCLTLKQLEPVSKLRDIPGFNFYQFVKCPADGVVPGLLSGFVKAPRNEKYAGCIFISMDNSIGFTF